MTVTPWLQAYILTGLRLDRSFQQKGENSIVDTYYGPAEWRAAVNSEPVRSFDQLADEAAGLALQLGQQGFEPGREAFLGKQLTAMEALAHIQIGRALPFFEQAARLLDIEPYWIPESEFEQALALIDRALPGTGDVRPRYQAWQERMRLPADKAELLEPLMGAMLAEAQRRTRQFVDLPEGDRLILEPKHGIFYGAANWYLGDCRSRMEMNADRPVYLFALLYQMCHEGYPGHHTESCMKERVLYRERGYLEQSLFFSFGPQLVISEGIASCAAEMIFTSAEAADWMREHVLSMLGISADESDLELMLDAFSVISPDDVSSNLAILIEAGRTTEEILDYALAYSPYSTEQIRSYLPWLDSWLPRIYSFTYSHGKRLVQPRLKGGVGDATAARRDFIRRLLTEQVLPSQLRREAEDLAKS